MAEIISGSEIDRITMFDTIRGIMIELMKGYPAYIYWGIIEGRFKKGVGETIRDLLHQQGFIEIIKTNISDKCYRLTPRGVEVANSLINLKYIQETHYFSKVLIWLTYIIAWLTFGLFIYGFFQGIISLWF